MHPPLPAPPGGAGGIGSRGGTWIDPADQGYPDGQEKKVRRMLSNRESARRSRKRKLEMQLELEERLKEAQAELLVVRRELDASRAQILELLTELAAERLRGRHPITTNTKTATTTTTTTTTMMTNDGRARTASATVPLPISAVDRAGAPAGLRPLEPSPSPPTAPPTTLTDPVVRGMSTDASTEGEGAGPEEGLTTDPLLDGRGGGRAAAAASPKVKAEAEAPGEAGAEVEAASQRPLGYRSTYKRREWRPDHPNPPARRDVSAPNGKVVGSPRG